jgi:hypothetical protein
MDVSASNVLRSRITLSAFRFLIKQEVRIDCHFTFWEVHGLSTLRFTFDGRVLFLVYSRSRCDGLIMKLC